MTTAQTKKIRELQRDLKHLLEAVKSKCLDCSAGSNYEVKHCFSPKCPIYAFRMGFASQEGDSTQGNEPEKATNGNPGGSQ